MNQGEVRTIPNEVQRGKEREPRTESGEDEKCDEALSRYRNRSRSE